MDNIDGWRALKNDETDGTQASAQTVESVSPSTTTTKDNVIVSQLRYRGVR